MKFTLFVLITGFSCFWAASLNDNPFRSLNNELVNNGISNDIEIELFSVRWSALNDTLRKVLSSFKGLQCTSKEIVKINEATSKFFSDLQQCGSTTTDSVDKLKLTAYSIILNANDILEINKKLYHEYDSHNKQEKMSSQHFSELYKKNIELKDEIQYGAEIIESIREMGLCATKAIKDLQNVFIQFPDGVRKCFNNSSSSSSLNTEVDDNDTESDNSSPPSLVTEGNNNVTGSENSFPSSLESKTENNGIANYEDAIIDMERFSWSALNNILRKLLSSKNGIECTNKEVLKIYNGTLQFIRNIRKCVSEIIYGVDKLQINAFNIISKASDILQINQELYHDSYNNNKMIECKTPKYSATLYNKNIELKDEIQKGANIIETAEERGICVQKATKELNNVLIRFPIGIGKCLLSTAL